MPAARTTDPATSHAAARAVSSTSLVQSRIVDIIRDASLFGSGITDEGIIATYGRLARVNAWTLPSPSSIRSRRKELADRDEIRPVTDKDGNVICGRTERGNLTQKWTVV
jgi:hypothetical protein